MKYTLNPSSTICNNTIYKSTADVLETDTVKNFLNFPRIDGDEDLTLDISICPSVGVISKLSFKDCNGMLHRSGGPVEKSFYSDGSLQSEMWMQHGNYHRDNGPCWTIISDKYGDFKMYTTLHSSEWRIVKSSGTTICDKSFDEIVTGYMDEYSPEEEESVFPFAVFKPGEYIYNTDTKDWTEITRDY